MPRVYRLEVGSGEAGLRLDRYLVKHVAASVSRSMIQRGVREGLIQVSDRPAKPHYKLRAGDMIVARFEELGALPSKLDVQPQPIPLEIVYEDHHVLVVNKPAGLVTHPAPGHWDGTLVNALLWHFAQGQGTGDKGQGLPRAGIVHRLDKDTSGLLLVAKTAEAHHLLSKQLKSREMSRRYLALVEGHLPLDAGTVNAAIGRHATHRKLMAIRHIGGRDARTHYHVLRRGRVSAQSIVHGPWSMDQQADFLYTALELALETGRTHQIRVHMAHVGHPVAADLTYGRRPPVFWQALGLTRQALHAWKLKFTHPATRRPVELTAPVPDELKRWLPTSD